MTDEGTAEVSADAAAPVDGIEAPVDSGPPAGNPAWDEMLGVIPAALHPAITPHLQRWDQNYQEVTTKYAPYKQFLDQGIDPSALASSLGFYEYANQNPRAIYDALVENFGEAWGLGQGQPVQPSPANGQQQEVDLANPFQEQPFNIEDSPVVQKLRGDLDTVVRALTAKEEAAQSEAVNQQIDSELNSLREKHGNYDERYVLSLAATGKYSLEQAVSAYKEMEGQIMSQQAPSPFAPRVISPSGNGMPSQRVDVTKLDNNGAKALAVQLAQSLSKQQ